MAHIACITNGLTGLRLASFEMLRRLRVGGHRITYMAPTIAREAVVREGLAYQDLLDLEAGTVDDIGNFAARLEALNPDLALIDTELPEVVLAAQAAGLKTVLLDTWMSIWKHPGLPPLHYPIQPGVSLLGSRPGIELAWRRHLLTRRFMDLGRQLKHGDNYRIARLRAYAETIGFPHRQEFDFDNWMLPFSFRTLPILVLHALEFEFAHQPRSHVHYVGPMVDPNRAETGSNPDDRAVIDIVLARRREGQSRLVFGGFGSFFTASPELLRKVFEAFAKRPDWDLVVPLGERLSEIDRAGLPDNVHLVAWAPQLALLERADVAIVHGGINTIDECVHFETPMLAYSGGITDMPGNVARLVHHRLGIEGDPKRDTPDIIVERIDRLMTDGEIAGQLAIHRRAAEGYRQEKILERTIDRFLTGDLAATAEPITSVRQDVSRGAPSTS